MLDTRLADELKTTLGQENVFLDLENRRKYAMDALRPYRAFPALPSEGYIPDVVVTPNSTEKIQDVVKLAARFVVPIVPYGGGTGLMGGATAVKGGIILGMSKVNKIISINRIDRMVTAQAGIVLETLNKALLARGLILGHDPWTRPIATLGGAISTNSLGYMGGRYGSIADQLLGVKVVLADGSLLQTRPVARTSTGINLTKLFVGTEGCLGIVTEATLRAFPKPEAQIIKAVRFSNFDAGFHAISTLIEKGFQPTILDYGEPAPSGRGAALYVGFHGPKNMTRAVAKDSVRILRECKGTVMSTQDAETFWRTRHSVAFLYTKRVKAMGTHPSKAPP